SAAPVPRRRVTRAEYGYLARLSRRPHGNELPAESQPHLARWNPALRRGLRPRLAGLLPAGARQRGGRAGQLDGGRVGAGRADAADPLAKSVPPGGRAPGDGQADRLPAASTARTSGPVR